MNNQRPSPAAVWTWARYWSQVLHQNCFSAKHVWKPLGSSISDTVSSIHSTYTNAMQQLLNECYCIGIFTFSMLKSLQKSYLENRYQCKGASELTSEGLSLQHRSNMNSSRPFLISSVISCPPKLLNELDNFFDEFFPA